MAAKKRKSRKMKWIYTVWGKLHGKPARVGVQFSRAAAERVKKQHNKHVREGFLPGSGLADKIVKNPLEG
jgi:hypothetical protein